MCVIIVKPAGVKMPSLTVLEKMWNCNRDGAGLAISNKRNVTIDKGFMTFEALKDYYERKQLASMTYKLVVVHFRIGTHGLKDGGNTHPFPLAGTPEQIRQLELTANEAIFHNGVFNLAVTEKHVSDTGQFIIDAAKKGEGACILSHWDSEKQTTGWSKLCVVRPAGCYDLRGTWSYSDQAEGCLVSNTGWTAAHIGKDYHDEAWGDHGKKGKFKKGQGSTIAPGYYSAWDDDDYSDGGWWNRDKKPEKLIAPFPDGFVMRKPDMDKVPEGLREFFKKMYPMNDYSAWEFDAEAWVDKNPGVDFLRVQPFVKGASFSWKADIPDRLKECFRWVQGKTTYEFDEELWGQYLAKLAETKIEVESNVDDKDDLEIQAAKQGLTLEDLIYDDEYEWAALVVPEYLWDDYCNWFYLNYNSTFELEEVFYFEDVNGVKAFWLDDAALRKLVDYDEDLVAAASEQEEMEVKGIKDINALV
jgi:hypothetical protein